MYTTIKAKRIIEGISTGIYNVGTMMYVKTYNNRHHYQNSLDNNNQDIYDKSKYAMIFQMKIAIQIFSPIKWAQRATKEDENTIRKNLNL